MLWGRPAGLNSQSVAMKKVLVQEVYGPRPCAAVVVVSRPRLAVEADAVNAPPQPRAIAAANEALPEAVVNGSWPGATVRATWTRMYPWW